MAKITAITAYFIMKNLGLKKETRQASLAFKINNELSILHFSAPARNYDTYFSWNIPQKL